MVVDVWVQQTTGPSSFNIGFGITCRESVTPPFGGFYFFVIKGYGAAEIWKYAPDGTATMLASRSADAIHLTPHANHLTVMCDGSSLALFANGKMLLAVDDSTYTEGAVSTFAYSENLTGVEVVFDNLTISAPHPEARHSSTRSVLSTPAEQRHSQLDTATKSRSESRVSNVPTGNDDPLDRTSSPVTMYLAPGQNPLG